MPTWGWSRMRRSTVAAAVISVAAMVTSVSAVGDAPRAQAAVSTPDVVAFGAATDHGGTFADQLASPVVGLAATPTGGGYWEVASDGGIFAFGDAAFHGSTGELTLNRPIVAIAATPTGNGYWLTASDGGIFSFGDATFHGSTGDLTLNRPIVAIAATPTGNGYWLTASDGGIFSFGDATFHGSTGDLTLNRPIVAIAATPTGNGYWLTASDGGIFSFGDATFHGSTGDLTLNRPIVAIAATPTGNGYWLTASDGGIFSFGDATFHGSAGGTDLEGRSVVAIAATPTGDGYWLALGRTRPVLPRGGRTLFPDWRVVAHYGGPQSPRLGVLGEGTPDDAAGRVAQQAAAYEGYGRPVLPAFELIATIANSAPGADGDYSTPLADDEIQRYLDAARRHGLLLILDLQPGRASFLDEAKRYERFLREPDVGLALDPEWSVRAPGTPGGGTIGSTDAGTINEVSAWLAAIVAEEDLPEKLLVVHQFTDGMVRDRHLVVDRPGLATTFHIDGFGGQHAKRSKYQQLRPDPPFAAGFKVFYDEDTDVFTPDEVMTTLTPPPDLVTYQ